MNLQLEHIDKTLESKVRLGIMAVLTVNESLDFKSLRTLLNLTDGNLVTHTRTLETPATSSPRSSSWAGFPIPPTAPRKPAAKPSAATCWPSNN